VTPQGLAEQTGLSLEEAELVLASRAAKAAGHLPGGRGMSRLTLAMSILKNAEKKVGVKPYEESK